MKEKDLIDMLLQRDERGIEELSSCYHAYCYSIAVNITGNQEDAEECVCDTWFQVWNAIPPAKPASLKLFAARITRNLAFNRYRNERAQKRNDGAQLVPLDELRDCFSNNDCVNEEVELRELKRLVTLFVAAQSTRNREIFLMRYFCADSVESIAARYGLSVNHVNVILHRLRRALKERIEKEEICI